MLEVVRPAGKTFDYCAAFIQVTRVDDSLGATLVYPESHDLARFLLGKLK